MTTSCTFLVLYDVVTSPLCVLCYQVLGRAEPALQEANGRDVQVAQQNYTEAQQHVRDGGNTGAESVRCWQSFMKDVVPLNLFVNAFENFSIAMILPSQDRTQQERIRSLEEVVHVLNESVAGLNARLEMTHEHVIERHLYLMLIEFTIFMVAMYWCLGRQKEHYT